MEGFYKNTGYMNNRNKKKTLILDIQDGTINKNGISTFVSPLISGNEFNIKFLEPFVIDKHSEIFLDSITTFNGNLSSVPDMSSFCLHINEFNIQTNVASEDDTDKNNIFNSIILPNENNNVNNYFGAVIQKGKKFNYICDINPCTLYSLSGKITSLNGSPAYGGGHTGEIYTYSISGITGWANGGGKMLPLSLGDSISALAVTAPDTVADVITGSDTAHIIVHTDWGADTIVFTSSANLSTASFTGQTTITLTRGADPMYTFTATSSVMLKDHGRFIAEFKIVSTD